jgi:hypothetical protein
MPLGKWRARNSCVKERCDLGKQKNEIGNIKSQNAGSILYMGMGCGGVRMDLVKANRSLTPPFSATTFSVNMD